MVRNRFNFFPMAQLSRPHLRNSPRAWLFAVPTKILEGLWILFYGEAKKRDLHFFVLGLFWYIGINTNPVEQSEYEIRQMGIPGTYTQLGLGFQDGIFF